MTSQDTNLAALILCGGKSTRMGKDKYEISYHGMPQWQYLYTLMQKLHLQVFVSCNAMQANSFDPSIATIIDNVHAKGPAVGLLSAHQHLPHCSWIVVACDTPLINEKTIATLRQQRDTNYIATAYQNLHNHLPEPLIALWEKEGLHLLKEQATQGIFCPRKLLINHHTKLIPPNFDMELSNANTSEDYETMIQWIKKHS